MGLELAPSRSPFAHFERSVPAPRAQVRVSTVLAAAAFADALAAATRFRRGRSPRLVVVPATDAVSVAATTGTNGTSVAESCTWLLK